MSQDIAKNIKNIEVSYKSVSICEYNNRISRLLKTKLEYMKKVEEIQKEINNTQRLKQDFCNVTLGGHTLREEREDGPYGERYRVCSTCGLDV